MKYRLTIQKSYMRMNFIFDDLHELGKIIESLTKALEKDKDDIDFTIEVIFEESEETD